MAEEILITIFRMVDQYSAGVKNMSASTRDFLASAKRVNPLLGRLGVVGAAAGLVAFANTASVAAASFDTMERTFAGALGGIEQGAKAMAYLESYATKSAFGLEDLARASAQLAASGLDVGRFLPIIERFALVSSGVDPQGLIQVASALARVKGGSFGEAMEVFRKAGVGSPDLSQQGIKVSKGGEIQATSEQVFRAIEMISEGRLKSIADSISGGAENIRANVDDVVAQAFRQIGREVNVALLPLLKSFTADMQLLVKSGVVPFIAQQFIGMGRNLAPNSNIMEEFFVYLAQVPVRLKNFVESIGNLIDIARVIGTAGRDKEAVDRVAQFDSDFKSGLLEQQLKLSEAQVRSRFRRARNAPEGPAPEFPSVPQAPEAEKAQDPVARNTSKLVELAQKSLDIQRQILGGGARAEDAASPVRIGAALGTNSPSVNGPERLLLQFAAELRREFFGANLAMVRNSGTPNRVARR